MAAPVVPDPTFSALYDDASKWTHPTLDHEYYTKHVGAPNPTTGNTMTTSLLPVSLAPKSLIVATKIGKHAIATKLNVRLHDELRISAMC